MIPHRRIERNSGSNQKKGKKDKFLSSTPFVWAARSSALLPWLSGLTQQEPDVFCIIIDLKCKGKQSEHCLVINLRLLISSERFSSGEVRMKSLEEMEEEKEEEESSSDWFWARFNLAAERLDS